MREIQLSIKVQTNATATDAEIAAVVARLIDCGLTDAQSSLEDGEGDLEQAQLATDLSISTPELAPTPRVLVTVSGGVADWLADDGVSVEVFDWDNYNDDPEGTGPVPASFSDLAAACKVPVEGEAQ